jgi:hypothetical protein
MGVAPGIYVDATARDGWMHGVGDRAKFRQKEAGRYSAGCRNYLMGRLSVTGSFVAAVLARASNHGIHRVKNDGEQHPENRGEEKTAHDLAYGMSLEEAG